MCMCTHKIFVRTEDWADAEPVFQQNIDSRGAEDENVRENNISKIILRKYYLLYTALVIILVHAAHKIIAELQRERERERVRERVLVDGDHSSIFFCNYYYY